MKKGIFITFEGPDGSGKSTQAGLLAAALKKKGYEYILTREPGGTPFAESIRNLLLKPGMNVFPLTELLLYAASRAQHTQELIKPALAQGKIVICDRYSDSTMAYQYFGRNLDKSLIYRLNEIAAGGLKPALTIVVDIKAEDGMKRVCKNGPKDRLENENIQFHERIRKGFLQLAKREPKRIKVVAGCNSIEAIHTKIMEITNAFLRGS
ncbi:MAG: dTMP kinase [Elusimicrobia bacterium]|nr:dTMP kinase [Elusimicrobiota bacterium]MBU2614348.1 dTMP kinase [Elusimicrobiota bacterium]